MCADHILSFIFYIFFQDIHFDIIILIYVIIIIIITNNY